MGAQRADLSQFENSRLRADWHEHHIVPRVGRIALCGGDRGDRCASAPRAIPGRALSRRVIHLQRGPQAEYPVMVVAFCQTLHRASELVLPSRHFGRVV